MYLRCHFTHDWVHEPNEWNGRIYSGAALRIFLDEGRRKNMHWIEDPLTRELVEVTLEPTPMPELVSDNIFKHLKESLKAIIGKAGIHVDGQQRSLCPRNSLL